MANEPHLVLIVLQPPSRPKRAAGFNAKRVKIDVAAPRAAYIGTAPQAHNSKTTLEYSVANRICFVELPAGTIAAAKSFYTDAFGFAMTDFGPTYSCTMTGDVDLGLQADSKEASRAPLPVIQVESLEATEARVKQAKGVITKAAFSFPGGRRFHFRDPAGNELAAMQPD